MTKPLSARLSNKELWRYSGLAIPTAFAGYPIYVLAPDYYATKYSVSLSLLGFLLLVLRLFDAFQDPLIGFISDKYRAASIWFLPAASIIICLGVYCLFNMKPTQPAFWFVFFVSITVMAYNLITINLNTYGCLWSHNPEEQIQITTYREGCGIIGLLIAVSLPSFFKSFVSEQDAYFYLSIILCILMIAAWIGFWGWLKKNIVR